MFIEVRRLGLEMTAEEMVTACKSQHAVAVAAANTGQSGREAHCIHSRCRGALHRPGMSPSRSRTARSAAELTSILVSKIERRALVGHAADVAHLGAEIAECGLVAVGGVAEQVKSVEGTRRAVVERGSNEVLGSRLATSGSPRRSGVACSIRLWLAGALGWATQHGVLKPCSPKVKPVTVAWVKPLYFTGSTGYLFSKWRARVARLESRSRKHSSEVEVRVFADESGPDGGLIRELGKVHTYISRREHGEVHTPRDPSCRYTHSPAQGLRKSDGSLPGMACAAGLQPLGEQRMLNRSCGQISVLTRPLHDVCLWVDCLPGHASMHTPHGSHPVYK
jgi:hypothetical protein